MPSGFECGRAGNVPRVDPRFIHTVLSWNGVRATKGPDSLSGLSASPGKCQYAFRMSKVSIGQVNQQPVALISLNGRRLGSRAFRWCPREIQWSSSTLWRVGPLQWMHVHLYICTS